MRVWLNHAVREAQCVQFVRPTAPLSAPLEWSYSARRRVCAHGKHVCAPDSPPPALARVGACVCTETVRVRLTSRWAALDRPPISVLVCVWTYDHARHPLDLCRGRRKRSLGLPARPIPPGTARAMGLRPDSNDEAFCRHWLRHDLLTLEKGETRGPCPGRQDGGTGLMPVFALRGWGADPSGVPRR
jgi:hypothetical protein